MNQERRVGHNEITATGMLLTTRDIVSAMKLGVPFWNKVSPDAPVFKKIPEQTDGQKKNKFNPIHLEIIYFLAQGFQPAEIAQVISERRKRNISKGEYKKIKLTSRTALVLNLIASGHLDPEIATAGVDMEKILSLPQKETEVIEAIITKKEESIPRIAAELFMGRRSAYTYLENALKSTNTLTKYQLITAYIAARRRREPNYFTEVNPVAFE